MVFRGRVTKGVGKEVVTQCPGRSARGLLPALARGLAVGLFALGPTAAQAQAPSPGLPPSGVVIFGGDEEQPPYQSLDRAGRPEGFNVDLMRAIAKVSGRNIEVRLFKGDVLDLMDQGRVDLAVVSFTEERTKDHDFLDEVWTVRLSAFFLPGRKSPPDSLSKFGNEIVAVRTPSLSRDTLVALPDELRPTLIAARDNREAVAMLLAFKATAVAGNDIGLRAEFARLGINEAPELLLRANPYRLATKKGRAAEFAWVSEALKKLHDTGEYSRLVEKHLSPPPAGSLRELAGYAGIAIAALLLVSALALTWNRSLRRQVAARTARLSEAAADRERTLAEIRDANRKLEAKNAELERFTYAVSHDLRSPLITIRGFLDHLERSAAAGRLDRFREDAARIEGAAARMDALLHDLLELSREGRALGAVSKVPMAAVARDAEALLRGPLRDRGVSLEIASDLPVVTGDRPRLLEVLQNLMENAIKFMGDQREPRIHVGFRIESANPVFLVADNGIGIEEKHREKIFQLFERLNPRAEGTGVGLALVKRIVEAHGGRIWVESPASGPGSIFCFTLRGGTAAAK
jgi:signal transduction histidine kinase/ABC-type amino acid transport substrate-binding protein